MPRKDYTKDWPQISRQVCEEAGWRCEKCGIANGTWKRSKTTGKPYQVRLNGCHLDQNPRNNNRDNLRAMCFDCHHEFDSYWNYLKAADKSLRKREEFAKAAAEKEEIDFYLAELGLDLDIPHNAPQLPTQARDTTLKDRIARRTKESKESYEL